MQGRKACCDVVFPLVFWLCLDQSEMIGVIYVDVRNSSFDISTLEIVKISVSGVIQIVEVLSEEYLSFRAICVVRRRRSIDEKARNVVLQSFQPYRSWLCW